MHWLQLLELACLPTVSQTPYSQQTYTSLLIPYLGFYHQEDLAVSQYPLKREQVRRVRFHQYNQCCGHNLWL